MGKEKDWLFRSKASELNPDVDILEDYKDSKTKVKVRCKLCGEEYYDLPSNILSGKLHRKTNGKLNRCRWCKHWFHTKKQQKDILHQLNCIYEDIKDIDFIKPYDPHTSQIECKCKTCGNTFFETLDNLYNSNYFCKECDNLKTVKKDTVPKQSARERKLNLIFKNSHNIRLISKDGANIICVCDNCGITFTVTGYMKRKKITCPHCYREKRNAVKRNKRLEGRSSSCTSIK